MYRNTLRALFLLAGQNLDKALQTLPLFLIDRRLRGRICTSSKGMDPALGVCGEKERVEFATPILRRKGVLAFQRVTCKMLIR